MIIRRKIYGNNDINVDGLIPTKAKYVFNLGTILLTSLNFASLFMNLILEEGGVATLAYLSLITFEDSFDKLS